MSDFTGDTTIDTGADLSPAPAEAAPAPAAESRPTIDDAIEAAFAQHEAPGQPRDEAGRFAAKAAEAAAKAQPAPQETTKPPAAEEAPSAAGMPASWRKEDAALWAKIPPDAQARIAQREEQISAGFKQYEGLAEYAAIAKGNGETLRGVLDRVKSLEDGMARDPVGTLMRVGQMYGIDMRALAQRIAAGQAQPASQAQQAPQPPQDIDAIVMRRLAEREAAQAAQQFFADPANKYAEQVAGRMAALLRADRDLSIKAAYEQACWADPQVRAELQREQAAQQATQQAKAAQASTQTAQRASKSLVGSGPAPLSGSRPMRTIDDAIEAAFAVHGA